MRIRLFSLGYELEKEREKAERERARNMRYVPPTSHCTYGPRTRRWREIVFICRLLHSFVPATRSIFAPSLTLACPNGPTTTLLSLPLTPCLPLARLLLASCSLQPHSHKHASTHAQKKRLLGDGRTHGGADGRADGRGGLREAKKMERLKGSKKAPDQER